jgi:hypothetical protein
MVTKIARGLAHVRVIRYPPQKLSIELEWSAGEYPRSNTPSERKIHASKATF